MKRQKEGGRGVRSTGHIYIYDGQDDMSVGTSMTKDISRARASSETSIQKCLRGHRGRVSIAERSQGD